MNLTHSQAGLFAAFLSAFLIYAITLFQPDISTDILQHISLQLSNSSTPAFTPSPLTAVQSINITTANGLFFASLALVILDAFLAMLVKTWLRDFDRSYQVINIPELRAKERERRLQGVERWRMEDLVSALPILIQLSLFLFCAGLVILLSTLSIFVASITGILFTCGLCIYATTTLISIYDPYAPYPSPFSRALAEPVRRWSTLLAATASQWRKHLMLYHSGTSVTIRSLAMRFRGRTNGGLLDHPGTELPVLVDHDCSQHPGQPCSRIGEPLPYATFASIIRDIPEENEEARWTQQTHADILKRMIETTPAGNDNIPLFLAILDQPLTHGYLRPQSVTVWKKLFDLVFPVLRSNISLVTPSVLRTLIRTWNFYSVTINAIDLAVTERLSIVTDEALKGGGPEALFAERLRQVPERLYSLCEPLEKLEWNEDIATELLWVVDTLPLHSSNIDSRGKRDGVIMLLRSSLIYLYQAPVHSRLYGPLLCTMTLVALSLAMRDPDPDAPSQQTRRYVFSGEPQRPFSDTIFCVTPDVLEHTGGRRSLELFFDACTRVAASRTSDMRQVVLPWILCSIKNHNFELLEKVTLTDMGGDQGISGFMSELWRLWQIDYIDRRHILRAAAYISNGSWSDSMRQNVLVTFEAYDLQVEQNPRLIKEPSLFFISAVTEWCRSNKERPWFRPRFPWLTLHLDNVKKRPTTLTDTELSSMTFDGPGPTKGLDRIAFDRLTHYQSYAPIPVEPRLLGVFLFSWDKGISLYVFELCLKMLAEQISEATGTSNVGSDLFNIAATLEVVEASEESFSRFFSYFQKLLSTLHVRKCSEQWCRIIDLLSTVWLQLGKRWRSMLASQIIKCADKRLLLNRFGVFIENKLVEFESSPQEDDTPSEDLPDLGSIDTNDESLDGTPIENAIGDWDTHAVTIHHYQRYQKVAGEYMSTLAMIAEDYPYDGLDSLHGMWEFCFRISDIHPVFRHTSYFDRIYKLCEERAQNLGFLIELPGIFDRAESDNGIETNTEDSLHHPLGVTKNTGLFVATFPRVPLYGTSVLPSGMSVLPSGMSTLPSGTSIMPSGASILPSGTSVLPSGTSVLPSGTSTLPSR